MESDVVNIDESVLRELGISRLAIPVPFIEAGGPANVYCIENADDSVTLFDTGISTPLGTASLREQAEANSVDLTAVKQIIISHGHVDHFGNAQLLAEATNAPVFVHAADRSKIEGHFRYSTEIETHWPFFLSLGIAEPTLQLMLANAKRGPSLARAVDSHRIELLDEGRQFHFKHFSVEVLHLPGHTPGLVCLYSAAQRLLFADDHVLARVSPNPLLDLSQGTGPSKFQALVSYLHSARRVQALELDAVLPGHGPSFRGHQPLLQGLFDFYHKRQGKLLAALEGASRTAFELIPFIFSKVDENRLYLLLSEVVANLEVLEQEQRIARTLVNGQFRFSLA